ncbi:MAG: phosphotransferase [Rubrobacteraceae bacterium]|jgi:thiamine kinase-like enzyme
MLKGVSEPTLERIADEMPGWRRAENLRAEFVSGGITNRNFRIFADGDSYFVRLAGAETAALGIDRGHEKRTVECAAEAGVGPKVVAYFPEHGCLVTEWIEGPLVPPEDLKKRDTLELLVRSVKTFHEDCAPIPGSFSPFRVVEQYKEFAESRGLEMPQIYFHLSGIADEIEASFQENPASDCPCHNDLLNANFLNCGDRIAIVDYEYAGMGDPFFDLGNLSINNDFDEATDAMLLEMYFGEATPARMARLKLMRVMSDFREAMWGVMQQVLSDLDFDYVEYADTHFQRCKKQSEDERYRRWIEDAAGRV